VGIRRSESRFEGAGGLGLFHRAWLAAEPRRALVVVHGFAEHSRRYEAFGEWFSTRGSSVHALDLRGHGFSDGARGYVDRFSDYLDDLELFLERVRAEAPALPLVLVGHSLGGLVVAGLLCERKPDIAAAVTSGAGLALDERMPGYQVAVARVARRIAPRLSIGAGIDVAALSRDPEVGRRYLADPLVFRRLTLSLAVEIFDAAQRTARGGAAVSVPMLLLHGEADSLCPPPGSRDFFETLAVKGSALRTYPGLRHEIFNEPEAVEVFQDALSWIEGLGV
jgi:alpha-beta hydrolase superfamily lysophospholipase